MRKWLYLPLALFLAAATSTVFAQNQVLRAALPNCSVMSTLATTCAHPLDSTVMSTLAEIKWTGDGLQPLLATSWSTPDGGKTWIIHLRHGVKWQDGAPFTAADVVFTFNTYANPKVGSRWSGKVGSVEGYKAFQAGQADHLTGIKALDNYTVQVTLSQANPNWMKLEQPYVVILPKHILGKVAPDKIISDPFWTHRVGTGPFIWKSYVPGESVTLVRNPNYFLGAPKLDKIVFTNYASASAELAALQSGALDEITYEASILPVTDIGHYQSLPNITVVPENSGAPIYIRINAKDPAFKDVRVREAMMYAINREGIIKSLFNGQTQIRNSLFTANWATAKDLNPYPYDPAKAKALLKAAGYDTSKTHDFIYYYSDTLTQNVVTAIQAYLAQVGIKVAPRHVSPATINQMYQNGSFELGYVALGQGLDPSTAEPAVQCGSLIALGYCNKQVDQLFAKGLSVSGRTARAPIYQQISKILNKQLPGIWLWQQVRPLAFSNRVVGPAEHWKQQPVIFFNMPVYNQIQDWYVKP